MRTWLITAFACILAGCANKGANSTTGQPDPAREREAASHILRPATQPVDRSPNAGTDPYLTPTPNRGDIFVLMDAYELVLPFGKISQNEDFWRRINEDNPDVAMRDLMLKNGLRFGTAPTNEWPYLKSLIDQYCPTARPINVGPTPSGVIELPMREKVELEDVFYLDRNGELTGRTYHHCDNLFNIAFEAIPHRPGDTRIKVCGIVRDLQKQLQVTILNQVREIEMKRPEQLYDMRLEAVVPFGHFLVIAPSPSAQLPYNIGSTFLVRPGPAERMEMVLVLIPRPGILEDQMTTRVPPPPDGMARQAR